MWHQFPNSYTLFGFDLSGNQSVWLAWPCKSIIFSSQNCLFSRNKLVILSPQEDNPIKNIEHKVWPNKINHTTTGAMPNVKVSLANINQNFQTILFDAKYDLWMTLLPVNIWSKMIME